MTRQLTLNGTGAGLAAAKPRHPTYADMFTFVDVDRENFATYITIVAPQMPTAEQVGDEVPPKLTMLIARLLKSFP